MDSGYASSPTRVLDNTPHSHSEYFKEQEARSVIKILDESGDGMEVPLARDVRHKSLAPIKPTVGTVAASLDRPGGARRVKAEDDDFLRKKRLMATAAFPLWMMQRTRKSREMEDMLPPQRTRRAGGSSRRAGSSTWAKSPSVATQRPRPSAKQESQEPQQDGDQATKWIYRAHVARVWSSFSTASTVGLGPRRTNDSARGLEAGLLAGL